MQSQGNNGLREMLNISQEELDKRLRNFVLQVTYNQRLAQEIDKETSKLNKKFNELSDNEQERIRLIAKAKIPEPDFQ